MPHNLDELFASSAAEVVGTLRLPEAENVRARGHRSLQAAFAVGIAVGVTLASGALAVTMIQQRAPDSVTAGPTPSRLSPPRPSGSPNSTTPPRTRRSNPPSLPVIKMPHEGEPGWQRVDDPDATAGWSSCRIGEDPTRDDRTAAITMTGPGHPGEEEHSPSRLTEQLFLYQNEAAARKAFDTVRQNLRTCGWMDPQGDDRTYLGHRFVNPNYPNLRVEQMHGFRQGKAIFLLYQVIGGAGMTSPVSPDVVQMSERVCSVLKECA